MSTELPPTFLVRQVQTETVPIVFTFDETVNGATFTLIHSLFGTLAIVGVGFTVSIPITEARAAAAIGDYTYRLIINEGVEGSEEIVARGHWTIEGAEPI